MHTITRLAFVATVLAIAVAPSAVAQKRDLGKKKGPTSKLFLAETKGTGEVTNEGRTYAPKQATAFDAPGSVLQTGKDSFQSFVYSNGTGMYVDQETRVEVDRFVQEPFRPNRNEPPEVEPSMSQSDVHVSRGLVGICTGKLVAGSTMNYSTPHASVNIRGGKVAMQTDGNSTKIFLLEGDVTVRAGAKDGGGALLKAGDMITITPGSGGRAPTIAVSPIDNDTRKGLDDKVNNACNARKTVTFEQIEVKAEQGLAASEEAPPAATESTDPAAPATTPAPPADGTPPATEQTPGAAGADDMTTEIVARPTTPAAPPTNIIVSPDRVGGGD